ncbi:uncharacterized protein LOC124175681 [Neodiprion fabricii]|uniref:uncharacterized protein LOC124175681 n=1 Tax=Neodiprion fabricii TaxID=2872261 RepID=UPI001ED8D6FB|nr:uncharacterized protein LOC124175681 [Neodiprion fabricii]XP_046412039.1 uncharacterized protein LOC124175681 [Neodiprion fabricii]
MPNESVPICGCGVALQELPKGRNGNMIPNKSCGTSLQAPKTSTSVPKWKNRGEEGQQGPASGPGSESGGTSSVGDQQWRTKKHNAKQGKRLNSSRRTRSAERPDSHYTYIDSGSSIVGAGIREDVIPEALYASINGSPNRTANLSSLSANNQTNGQNNHSQPVYAIPSMTSPPPTYDVAMWQSGLPPSYEEYLSHNYPINSRSHTPPPPWSDSGNGHQQSRRNILASQPDLREYLNQLAKAHAQVKAQALQAQAQNNNHTSGRLHQQRVQRESTTSASNLQVSRDQAVVSNRARTRVSRSQSESRARQQRVTTMYADAAFCMETTAIQSAFEHGVAFCSLM